VLLVFFSIVALVKTIVQYLVLGARCKVDAMSFSELKIFIEHTVNVWHVA